MDKASYRRILWDTARGEIIPRLQDPSLWRLFLAQPPFYLPPDVGLAYHEGVPLASENSRRSQGWTGHSRTWAEENVHTTYAPYMGFVLSGAMDLRIGITEQMADEFDGELVKSNYALLSIPENTFFIIPPGVPHASGRLGHWERNAEPSLQTQIFWIHFLPPGIQCHMSWTTPAGYASHGSHFVLDPHLLPAVDALISELRLRSQSSPAIVHSLMLFISHRVERDLKTLLAAEVKTLAPEAQPGRTDPQVIEQACAYIQAHYREKISIRQVAEHTFVSASHLSRLFKAAKGVTINEYLTNIRLEYACTLLKETRMGVKAIGRFVGYPSRAHFCQVFSRHIGCSPLQFRKKS